MDILKSAYPGRISETDPTAAPKATDQRQHKGSSAPGNIDLVK